MLRNIWLEYWVGCARKVLIAQLHHAWWVSVFWWYKGGYNVLEENRVPEAGWDSEKKGVVNVKKTRKEDVEEDE